MTPLLVISTADSSAPPLTEAKLARVFKTPRTSHPEAVTYTASDDAGAMKTA